MHGRRALSDGGLHILRHTAARMLPRAPVFVRRTFLTDFNLLAIRQEAENMLNYQEGKMKRARDRFDIDKKVGLYEY